MGKTTLQEVADRLDGEFNTGSGPGSRNIVFPKSKKSVYLDKFKDLYAEGYVVAGMCQSKDEITLFFGDLDEKEM